MTGANLTFSGRPFTIVLPPALSRIQEAITAQPLFADASLLALFDTQAYATGDLSEASDFDEVFDFSRASDGYAFNVSQTLTEYATNVPRFEYDPLTTAPKGLLIEPAQTNLLAYNRALDNAYWTKMRASITADVAIAPDGTLTADKLVVNTVDNEHHFEKFLTYAAGQYTHSVFGQGAGCDYMALRPLHVGDASGSPTSAVGFSLLDASTSIGVSSAIDAFSGEPMANGWVRGQVTVTNSGPVTLFGFRTHVMSDPVDLTFSGDDVAGVNFWGAQLVTGPYAGSYIPTGATTATRAADLLEVKPAVVADVWNDDEWTVLVEATLFNLGASQHLLVLEGANPAQDRVQFVCTSSGFIGAASFVAGSADMSGTGLDVPFTFGQAFKYAVAFKDGRFAACANGGAISAQTGKTQPNVGAGVSLFKSFIDTLVCAAEGKTVAIIPRALTDAELQAITS